MLNNESKKILSFIREFNIRTYKALSDFSDCSICGLCCKIMDVPLIDTDIKTLINKLGIEKKRFLQGYTQKNLKNPISKIIMKQPCKFLENNTCKIYKDRPATCKNYPVYLYPGSPPYFRIEALEWCMLSTNFFNGFIEFSSKYQPEVLKRKGILDDFKTEGENVIIKEIPFVYFYKYIIWLESKSEKDFFKRIKKFDNKYRKR